MVACSDGPIKTVKGKTDDDPSLVSEWQAAPRPSHPIQPDRANPSRPGHFTRFSLIMTMAFYWSIIASVFSPYPVFAQSAVQPVAESKSNLPLDQIILATDLIATVIQQEDDIRITEEEYLAINELRHSEVNTDQQTSVEQDEIPVAEDEMVVKDRDLAMVETAAGDASDRVEAQPVGPGKVGILQDTGSEVDVIGAVNTKSVSELAGTTSESSGTTVENQVSTAELQTSTSEVSITAQDVSMQSETDTTTAKVSSQPDQSPATEIEIASVDSTNGEGPDSKAPSVEVGSDEPPLAEIVSAEQTIRTWAEAWSRQDLAQYLGFYATSFIPDNGNLTRDTWEKLRRERVSKPRHIAVALSELNIAQNSDSRSEARFIQAYQSDSFKDRVVKTMELIKTEQGWEITSEKVVNVLE